MYFTIKSRKINREFNFRAVANCGYISLEVEDGRWEQICRNGDFYGSTLECSNEENFEGQCRSWYRAYMRNN